MHFKKNTKLIRLDYSRPTLDRLSEWGIEGIHFDSYFNLIVGKNASGKSKTLRLLLMLARVFKGEKALFPGHCKMEFRTNMGITILYEFEISNRVLYERILVDGSKILERDAQQAIITYMGRAPVKITVPTDKLTLHILSVSELELFPVFEDIKIWALHMYGFKFDNKVQDITAADSFYDISHVEELPLYIEKLSASRLVEILNEMNTVGYEVRAVQVVKVGGRKEIRFIESGIDRPLPAGSVSQSMFNVFSLLVFIEYLYQSEILHTVIIDNLCKGLDFERSGKLGEVIFERYKLSGMQFIVSSNDSFLLNSIDIKYWNILVRQVSKIRALNYDNTKIKFDNFKSAKLDNFALFTSGYLKKLEHGDEII